jgi:nucleoside-diphosphate-sugar epimerase
MKKKVISILGCGWYGLALAEALLAEGYVVKGSTTSRDKILQMRVIGIDPYLINLGNNEGQFDHNFFNCDVLVVSIPPRKNNTEAAVDFVGQVKNIAAIASHEKVKHVLFISSTGIYQDGNFIVDETIEPEPSSETGKSLLDAETFLKQQQSFTTTIIRFGGLIGPNRNLARHFAGKVNIANGLSPINLIHLTDCIGLTSAILAQKKFGYLYHGVCPSHPTRADFYTQLCIESGFPTPEFVNELQDWKQIESINVPKVLAYEWKILFSRKR